jgi:hypothetical protein
VSRDIIVQDIPWDAVCVRDIDKEWKPQALPFCRQDVIAAVMQAAPSADFSDPAWGQVELPGVHIDVNIANHVPLESFALHVLGSDRAAADEFIRSLLKGLGARALDSESETGLFEHCD